MLQACYLWDEIIEIKKSEISRKKSKKKYSVLFILYKLYVSGGNDRYVYYCKISNQPAIFMRFYDILHDYHHRQNITHIPTNVLNDSKVYMCTQAFHCILSLLELWLPDPILKQISYIQL